MVNRIAALEPAEPIRRYERGKPDELIHLDINKLGRLRVPDIVRPPDGKVAAIKAPAGRLVHIAIDNHSRVTFAGFMPSEKKRSATAFLRAALSYYASLGIKVERVMTDNGGCYKSFAFRRLCKRLGLRHIRTKPYTPETNGQACRVIQTGLRERADAQALSELTTRKSGRPLCLRRYNRYGSMPPSMIEIQSADSALPRITC